MSNNIIRQFLNDERGGYTVWSLIWFSLYVAIGGLAVDMTDAFRNQTMLQSTADASAMAGVISLPDAADAVAQAVAYSGDNMYSGVNGTVLKGSDVIVGHWVQATRSFSTGTAPADSFEAVLVTTRRADVNQNPIFAPFLGIVSAFGIPFNRWNINTEAIAIKYIPDCLSKQGLVAKNKVDVTSNNGFSGICIHGENFVVDPGQNYAVDMGNNNTFDDSVQVSMPDLNDLNGKPNVCTMNPGLCDPGTLVAGHLIPKDVALIDSIIEGIRAGDSAYLIDAVVGNTTLDADGKMPVTTIADGENFTGPYADNTVYDIQCSADNKILSLPADTLVDKTAIVTNCQVKASSGLQLADMMLASTSMGNGINPELQQSIDLASDVTIGTGEFCSEATPGAGQVQMFSPASIKIAAGPTVSGLRAVVGGDFQLAANNDVAGISVQAGNNITATANGEFTFCGPVKFDGPYAWHYRLVH